LGGEAGTTTLDSHLLDNKHWWNLLLSSRKDYTQRNTWRHGFRDRDKSLQRQMSRENYRYTEAGHSHRLTGTNTLDAQDNPSPQIEAATHPSYSGQLAGDTWVPHRWSQK
jgi:hypothetical protein